MAMDKPATLVALAEKGNSRDHLRVWKWGDSEQDDRFVFALAVNTDAGTVETNMSRDEATDLRDALTALLGDR